MIQANVTSEISAMKDYVIEVATEAEKGVPNGRNPSYSDISPMKETATIGLIAENSMPNDISDQTAPINMENVDVNSLETSDIADTSVEENIHQTLPSDEDEVHAKDNTENNVMATNENST